jgi:cytochrome P450
VPFADSDALARADRAMAEMNDVLIPELSARRAAPRADLLTALVEAAEDGERLSEEEMLGGLHVLIVAGHDTTSNTLTLGLEALARHPDVWEYLYRTPDRTLDVCLELMRYIAMSTLATAHRLRRLRVARSQDSPRRHSVPDARGCKPRSPSVRGP